METARSTAPLFTTDSSHVDVAFGQEIWQRNLYGANNAVPEGIYRHILVSDIQPIRLYLPQTVLNSLTNVYDPLPPGPGFDDDYFRSMYEGGRQSGSASGPRAGASSQQGLMQRLMQALQAGGGAGAGGDIDADTQAAIMAQFEQIAAARGGGEEGAMPGNLAGGDEDENEEESDAEAEAQVEAGGFFDFLRGMMATRVRQPVQAEPTTESESDREDASDRR